MHSIAWELWGIAVFWNCGSFRERLNYYYEIMQTADPAAESDYQVIYIFCRELIFSDNDY